MTTEKGQIAALAVTPGSASGEIDCPLCGGYGWRGGTVYFPRFSKCPQCHGAGYVSANFEMKPQPCGDCDPCLGGRADQCAIFPSPNVPDEPQARSAPKI